MSMNIVSDRDLERLKKTERNKAIDEIVKRFKDWMLENDGLSEKDIQEIDELADQMKGV